MRLGFSLSPVFVRSKPLKITPQGITWDGNIVSNLIVTAISGGKSANVKMDLYANTGNLYFVVLNNTDPVPNALQISAGTSGNGGSVIWKSNAEIMTIDSIAVGPDTLVQDSPYIFYTVHKDDILGFSNVYTYSFNTTDEVPVLSNVSASSGGEEFGILQFVTDDPNGNVYYIASKSNVQPTRSQILVGNDAVGFANFFGTQTIVGARQYPGILFGGLVGANTYYVHAFQRDIHGANSNIVTTGAFTTDPAEFEMFRYYNTGIANLQITNMTSANNQSDPFGTANAVLFTHSGAADPTVSRTLLQWSNTTNNIVRIDYKLGRWDSAAAYIRFRFLNLQSTPSGYVNMRSNTWLGGHAFFNTSVTPLANNWYRVYFEANLRPVGTETDFNGALTMTFGDETSSGAMLDANTHEIYIHNWRASNTKF